LSAQPRVEYGPRIHAGRVVAADEGDLSPLFTRAAETGPLIISTYRCTTKAISSYIALERNGGEGGTVTAHQVTFPAGRKRVQEPNSVGIELLNQKAAPGPGRPPRRSGRRRPGNLPPEVSKTGNGRLSSKMPIRIRLASREGMAAFRSSNGR